MLRERGATPREAFVTGTVLSALEHERDRNARGVLSHVATCVNDDSHVTGELTIEFAGHAMLITITEVEQ